MARTRRSDEELKIGLEHLLDYELDQMERLAYVLASNITGYSVLTNAMLEAFVLHFRCILSFLYETDGAKPNDVLAIGYFDDPKEWTDRRPPISDALRKARTRAAKEMAHLTYDRQKVTPEQKRWSFIELAQEIRAVLDEFLATQSRRGPFPASLLSLLRLSPDKKIRRV